jgi:hypothetical protein
MGEEGKNYVLYDQIKRLTFERTTSIMLLAY